ncbi:MAG: cysteine desulfurase [Alphaproteobacteria bacterium]|nr:cysteine desulfurase [Alphaproteobacteria bacterium]
MNGTSVYLDHNASAPLLPEAGDAVRAALTMTGNPSSVHAAGRAVRAAIDTARGAVAGAAGAMRRDVVFTGSATEALTQAIIGGARAFAAAEIVVGATEHAAVLRAAEATELPVTRIGVDDQGRWRHDEIEAALARLDVAGGLALFALNYVNNETGVVQDLAAIEALVGPTRHVLVVDAVQAFGKLDLGFAGRASDMMAISAHKIGGPAGIGALLMKPHCDDVRLIPGGGQETGRRGGTEALLPIAGFGAAANAFAAAYRAAGVKALRDRIEVEIRALTDDVVVFGAAAERMGNVTSFAVPGLAASVAMMALDLDGIAISSGSACSSGKVGRSHVLAAMGVRPELAEGALRVSLGWNTLETDIDAFVAAFAKVLKRRQTKNKEAAA